MTQGAEDGVRIGLSAVVMTLKDRQAVVLTTPTEDGSRALPFGPFDPVRDRTFERALRDFVTAQTGIRLGFVEQLYTFGDAGRASPRATPGPGRHREVSVGYLALTPDAAEGQTHDARWDAVFEFFPWEDRRGGQDTQITKGLHAWADGDEHRLARARALFALTPDHRWNGSGSWSAMNCSTKRVWSPRPGATPTCRPRSPCRAASCLPITGASWRPRSAACGAS